MIFHASESYSKSEEGEALFPSQHQTSANDYVCSVY